MLAIGNSEPLPDNLPEELKAILRRGRTEAGWDDNGNKIPRNSDLQKAAEQDNTDKLPTIDSIIDYIKLSEGTDAKMTEIGWERFGENIEEAKQAILALKAKWEREARIDVANRVVCGVLNNAWIKVAGKNMYFDDYVAMLTPPQPLNNEGDKL